MNIAFFTDTYLPNTDGVVTSMLNSRRELEKRGHNVFVFSPGTKKNKEENRDDRVYYFTSTSFKPYPDYRIAVFNFFSPVKLIKDLKIDVIHSHGVATTGLAAIQSSQKLHIPAVATFHTLLPEAVHYLTTQPQMKSVLQGIAWKYLSWYYSSYKKTIVPSEFARRILVEHGVGNTVIQPSAIDTAIFNAGAAAGADAARRKLGIKKNEAVVLFIGRIAVEKNLEMLIDAAPSVLNLVPNAKFVIAGKGPAESYYRELVNRKGLGPQFLFTGYVDPALLPGLYATSDALAFPSNFDTQGLVVLEAMATGTPAVVRKGTAPAEFITDGKNGEVFSDHFDFHEKIVAAIKNKGKMSAQTAETAKAFSKDKMADRLESIYSSLATPNSKA